MGQSVQQQVGEVTIQKGYTEKEGEARFLGLFRRDTARWV